MQGLIPHGTPMPLARGVDLPFFVRTGVHPFLPPWSDPKLEISSVALRVDRSSFELTRPLPARRRAAAARGRAHRGILGGHGLRLPPAEKTRRWP